MSRRLWFLLLAAGAILLLALGWRWWPCAAPPLVPPMPAHIEEAEVRELIESARARVLARPDSSEVWGHLGMVLLAQLFDREAVECFTEAQRLDETDPRWPYARALVALKRDPEKAPALLRQAAERAESWPSQREAFWLKLGETLLEKQSVEEAITIFREVRQRQPKNQRAALGLAIAARLQGDLAAAHAFYEEAKHSPHARKLALSQLSALERAAGKVEEAERYAREAAALKPDPPWLDPILDVAANMVAGKRGLKRRISELETNRQYEEAAQLYLQELQRAPTIASHIGAGVNLARLRRYDEAEKQLREALRLDPDHEEANYALGLTLFTRAERKDRERKGCPEAAARFREAIARMKKVVAAKPGHGRACTFWGLALMHLGKPEEALAPLRQGLTSIPADFQLQLTMGEALRACGKPNEARPWLEKAAKQRPEDSRPRAALAALPQSG